MKPLPRGAAATLRELARWRRALRHEDMPALVVALGAELAAACRRLTEGGGGRPGPPDPPAWLRTGEAAARLGVGRDFVRALAEDGRLPGARRVGRGHRREWRIPVAALANADIGGNGDIGLPTALPMSHRGAKSGCS